MSKYRKISYDEAAAIFKVLSNPNRLKILMRILASCCSRVKCDLPGEESCIGSLARDLGIGGPTVSHHIKELRQAGLIRVERQGQKRYCYAETEKLRVLADYTYGLIYADQAPEQGRRSYE